jgi:phenylpyruvate tautomerase PptA (4-oxalocrotonate tautomerase family)
MPFIEVFSPAGAVSPEQRDRIAERLIPEVMNAEGGPDNEVARSISWVVWHEPTLWSIGGKTVGGDELPPYVVRVTVPAGGLNDAKRAEIVKRVTRVLADADAQPERLYDVPLASFVLLNEVPEGNWGSVGQIFRFSEIASYILTGSPGELDERQVNEAFGLSHRAPAQQSAPVTS